MAEDVGGGVADSADSCVVSRFLTELVSSPVNLGLLAVCAFLLYKILRGRQETPPKPKEPELPPMKKRDFSLSQLKEFDGRGSCGRILIAVNGKVFDVTRGKRFYGPDGPYGVFAGRDASRGLATFSLTEEALKDEYDDLSNLSMTEMESVKEWEMQFTEKYDLIGRLLKPGEEPADYTDTEEEHSSYGANVESVSTSKNKSD